ncbi:hypothetical protein Q1695_014869 [Nippostrongylus brasiliensis]|nr:hypothetical protein Q1695_014869 [Nippostrongylus brasiliensis]
MKTRAYSKIRIPSPLFLPRDEFEYVPNMDVNKVASKNNNIVLHLIANETSGNPTAAQEDTISLSYEEVSLISLSSEPLSFQSQQLKSPLSSSSSFSLSQPASSPVAVGNVISFARTIITDRSCESGVEKSTPVVHVRQSENVDFRGVARNLIKGNEIVPKLLGEALGHFDDASEGYHELIGGQLWECSVNMREVKQLQSECVQLPKSSDAVVTRLMEFVNKQTHTIVGMAAMVSR